MLVRRNGIDRQVRIEKETNKSIRKHEDRMKGLSRSKGAERGDFKLCKESDKLYADYRKFKSKKDREKITKNLEQLRREQWHG